MSIQGTQHYISPPFEVLDINDIDELPAKARDEFYQVLDGIENSNIGLDEVKDICAKYGEYPCFALLHVDVLNAHDEQEMAFHQLNEAIKKHPTSLGLKINLGRMFVYYNMLLEFEDLMHDWLDIKNIEINRPLYLNDFYQLLMLYVDYFHIEEDKSILTHIYCWTLHDRFKDISMDLSVEMIKKQYELEEHNYSKSEIAVEPEEVQDSHDTETVELDTEINVQFYENLALNDQAYNPIIQNIMELDCFMDLDEPQLQEIDHLEVNDQLIHDVHWMIKKSVLSGLRDNAMNTEHIITAIFIIGAKGLSQCVPAVLHIYGIHEHVGYRVFEDDELYIVGQGIGGLLDDHMVLVDQLLKDPSLHWYHKSILFQIIAFRLKSKNELYNVTEVKGLAEHYYQQKNKEALTWLCQAFIGHVHIPLKEFFEQEKFIKLYDSSIIDFENHNLVGLGLDLIFDYNMVEIHLIMDEIYVEREEVMNELLAEFENEGNTEPLLNTTEVQQIWEIINLNAIESIKQSSQELVEDSSELNHPTSLGPELGNNESCPCGSGRPYKRCCFNLN